MLGSHSAIVGWIFGQLFLVPGNSQNVFPSADETSCRDRFLEPFSSISIWNTAIGSGAVFAPAGLYNTDHSLPTNFHNDQDFIVRAMASDPLTDWIHQGDWGPDDHCQIKGNVVRRIPFPFNWTSASDCGGASFPSQCRSPPGQPNNNAMGLILPDNVTVVQMQPVYRCSPGSPILARFGNTTDGCPQRFPNETSIFGDGIQGSHGGSGLSSIGGTIRLGELLNTTGPIPHALKIELQHQWYYGESKLQPVTPYNEGRCQYVWPATGSDSGTVKAPGGLYKGKNPHAVPGALLAIPLSHSIDVVVRTIVGQKIKQAMVDYGAYIVDDTGAGNSAAICMESAVNDEMRREYGYAMTYPHGVSGSPTDPGQELYHDLLAIFRALHAVVNNSPSSIGGGGRRRVPQKPPICM